MEEHLTEKDTGLYTTVYGNEQPRESLSGKEVRWVDLGIVSAKTNVTLLSPSNGIVRGGRFLAVMGSSGSGKTTFLNQLSGRGKDVVQTGGVTFGGLQLDQEAIKHISGYVLQDDILFDKLTVEEVLLYATRLKMHPASSTTDHLRRVQKLLHLVDLVECRHVVVGSPLVKGISGGQRKRLCVALELITRPNVLFLDEPTTGLDSVTALSLVHTLHSLAHSEHVTVVSTIHQPSRRMFDLFDDLLLLDHGNVVYHGIAHGLDPFFARAGFPCPALTNPTEWALSVIADETNRAKVIAMGDKQEVLLVRMLDNELNLHEERLQIQIPGTRLSWIQQFCVLTERSLKLECRSAFLILVQLIQTIIMAVFVGTVYLHLPDTVASVTTKRAALFFCAINQGYFGALLSVNIFPAERLVILRERLAGWYSPSAYVCAKAITEILFQSVYPLIFTCIVYFLIGLKTTASSFFIFLGLMELCMFSANSIALLISVVTGRIIFAAAALPLAMEVARLFGGYYMAPISLPVHFSWLTAISYVNYVYMGAAINEFTGLDIKCNATTTTICLTGDQVLNGLGIGYIPLFGCALVLIGLILVIRIVAYVILKWKP